jgi:hypothetical protein
MTPDTPVPATALTDLLTALRRTAPPDGAIAPALEALASAVIAGIEDGHPFLTVLIRTRGDRPETLRDSLLCLASQTDDDFEVVLLVHDVDDAGAAVTGLVDEYPASFSSRVRVLPVSGGGRSRPLNVGLAEARGRYITVFDDDDIVFGHWVEVFHDLAREHPGRILRAGAATQNVTAESWARGETGIRSLTRVSAEYDPEFDPFHHLSVNHTPFMSYAFPAVLFRGFGLTFDESLPVLEDWDMLLRGSAICGVAESPIPTSVYRRWEVGASSTSEHHTAEWEDATARVIDGIDRLPLLAPPGSAHRIRRLIADENAAYRLTELLGSRSWRWAWPLRKGLAAAALARTALRRRAR